MKLQHFKSTYFNFEITLIDPNNAVRLENALKVMIDQNVEGAKDLKSVSKVFDVPYNTLRDNYLK